MVKSKDVFVAGGIPSITYVGRSDLKLEQSLKDALNEGHQIICVTGPTKSGKTVLCNRVLAARKSLWVQGGQVESPDEFWENAAEKLGLVAEKSTTKSASAVGGLTYVFKAEVGQATSITEKHYRSPKLGVLEQCKVQNICLVVDDFHYLNEEIQRNVIRTLKSEVYEGLDVILIAVPHRAFDAISVEPEMQGRFIHLQIPAWDPSELREIGKKGFPELKMEVPDVVQAEFADQAFGSPILMQRFCGRLCSHFEVSETLVKSKEFNPSQVSRETIYASVAENFGFPAYKILADGPQSRTDRAKRVLRSGSGQVDSDPVDIYKAVLLAIAQSGPKVETSYNDIRDVLKTLLVEGDVPQKQQVTNTLKYMAREARKKLSGEPPIEWRDDVLYITDPSLLFYLKWSATARK